MRGPATAVVHPALDPSPDAPPLGEADSTDRTRVGVVLQAAGLLAHLERAGWRLAHGWSEARLDGDGCLRGIQAEPGRTGVAAETRLRQMVTLLFGAEEVAGRGEGRRAIRVLMARWRDGFHPSPAERLPARILSAAPFLLGEEGASHRPALVAAIERKGGRDLSIALPSAARRRVRAAATDLETAADLLGSDRFAALWAGGEGDPRELAAAGRWGEATRAWEAKGLEDEGDRLEYAEALYSLGRFQSAVDVLEEIDRPEARCLSLGCLHFLGRLEPGRQLSERLLEEPLPPESLLRAAAFALRLHAALAEPAEARRWVERARRRTPSELSWRVELLAAEEAWDSGRRDEMAGHLRAAREALADPDGNRRYQQVAALTCLGAGDAEGVVRHTARALATDRRTIPAWEAASLWNDHAVGRIFLGDLAGGERACAHAVRLMRENEGPRRDTLALRNLAEVRLRRGRLLGVRETLERARERNRRDGNLRAGAEDRALWARYELVQGRPAAALETLEALSVDLEEARASWHRDEIRVLEARALGWLGRPEDAAAALDGVPEDAVREMLEPEERPALWALAGDRDRALDIARDLPGPVGDLWSRLLGGEQPPARRWEALDGIESYRAARWVWDVELVAPGSVPPDRIRRGIEAFRRVGAGPFAERLATRFEGPWRALSTFVRLEAPDAAAARELVAAAGYGEARLLYRAGDRVDVLADGPGGETTLATPCGEGVLELSVREGGAPARALLDLLARLLPPPAPEGEERETVLPGLVGRSEALRRALAPLSDFARGSMPVLVLGETGTGKELVARQVHRLGQRADGPFVVFDCTTLSDSLGLSQLFGHVRGAFTGADRDRMGPFELARGGTLFLDEIGELPLAGQAMLLRAIQESEIQRVGESLPRKVDVRIVAATHRDLEEAVREGTFREDLLFRLRVADIELPPLRARRGDVALLAEHFLTRFGREYGQRTLSARARKLLGEHHWPGNVRELEAVIHRAVALARDGVIRPEHLRLRREEETPVGNYHRQIEDLRRNLVVEALERTGGNRTRAAKLLGITRQALAYLIKQLELD